MFAFLTQSLKIVSTARSVNKKGVRKSLYNVNLPRSIPLDLRNSMCSFRNNPRLDISSSFQHKRSRINYSHFPADTECVLELYRRIWNMYIKLT